MPAALTVRDVLRGAMDSAHGILEATMADVDNDLANRPAPGIANSVGSAYAHLVLSEDRLVNGVIKGSQTLAATSWAGRTGVDREPPGRGAHDGGLGEWYKTVKVDLGALREYAKAVYANSEAFISSVADVALSREIEGPMGKVPLAQFFSVFVTAHCNNLAGEISANKGAFGRKGYPF